MKNWILTLAVSTAFFSTAIAQTVGIGNTSPNNKSLLEIGENSGNQGLLLPRLKSGTITTLSGSYGATEQGMLVYDIDNDQLQTWDGTSWNTIPTGNDGDWDVIGGNVINTTNKIGVGVNLPRAKMQINSATNDTALYITGNGSVGLFSEAGAGDYSAIFSKGNVYINSNLSIGIATPGADLHVKGEFIYDDGFQSNGNVLRSDASGLARWVPHDVSFNKRTASTYVLPVGGGPAIFDGAPTFNEGGATISPTGEYRVPVSGIYWFHTTIMLKGSGGSEVMLIELAIDGTPAASTIAQCPDLTTECSCSLTSLVNVDKDDVVSINLRPLNGVARDIQGDNTQNLSYFSGHLVHSR